MGALTRALTLAIAGSLAGCTVQSLPVVVSSPSAIEAEPAAVRPAGPDTVASPTEQGYGWLNLTVRWPEPSGYNVALLPTTTNSLVIWVKKDGSTIGTPTLVSRQPGTSLATASLRVEAASNLSVEIKAYREASPDPATAAPIAQNAGVVNVVRSKVTPLALTLVPLNVPTVTAFDHNLGKVGETITLTGTQFGTGTVPVSVSFNGVPATTVTRTTATTLTAVVPANATTGKVVVTADGVESQSPAIFWVAADFQLIQPLKETWDLSTSASRQVLYGKTVQFSERHVWAVKDGETADQYGTPPSVTWALTDPTAGTLSDAGLFTAATTHVSAAITAKLGHLVSNAITVQMVGVNSVTLDKTSLTLNAPPPDGLPDQGYVTTAQLTATVDTSAPYDGGVVWASSDTSRVSVSNGFLSVAPNAPEGEVIITATSFDDPSKKATASVTVTTLGDLVLGIE